jgi:hypothetical protein
MILRHCWRSIGSRCHRVNVRTANLAKQSFVEERHQLRLLRQELGIDPPPTDNTENRTSTEETVDA